VKVALVHDWLTGMRGGERVLERLCGLFPDADIFTLLWTRGAVSPAIERHRIETAFIQHLPAAARMYRWYLPLFPAAIERFDLAGYDAVISSTHCVAGGVIAPAGARHVSYVHTPMRYIWELESVYFPPGRFPWPASAFVRRTCARLREWDVRTSQRPGTLIANSAHVAERIRRHWGRTASVVHPPVDLERFSPSRGARDYDLIAGAFAPYKRADLAIEACRRLGRRVRVVGSGQEQDRLRALAGPDVEFMGWVEEAELPALYQNARTLLFPGEEDFGMVPVEAMASGCPVIAFGRGGALETVGRGASEEALATVARGGAAAVPGGVLFGEQTVDAMCEALKLADHMTFDPDALAAQAAPFAPEAFDRGFMAAFESSGTSAGART
jgi:glycosyltransferase involved in cell wall biosynthesis